jgi:hypothetical protein
MALPFDPRTVADRHADPSSGSGIRAMVVSGFLTVRDRAEGTGSPFASCAAGMAASTSVADAMRAFVAERVWNNSPVNENECDTWVADGVGSSHRS